MVDKNILKSGVDTLKIEADTIIGLIPKINKNFVKAVKLILKSKGRVVVTGIGKSAAIGRKITATLASTGTPALFIHATEGGHGDLGMIMQEDVVLAISYSGETEELNNILPAIKRIGVSMISMTGNLKSTLAKYSDVVLNIKIKKEACPMGLAPTSSTTATLVMGDALAVALINEKKFSSKEFALYHPAGSLGRMLLLTVNDVMHKGKEIPAISENADLKTALLEITSKMLGVTAIINDKKKLVGVFTDGDLRRIITQNKFSLDLKISKVMSKKPKMIDKDKLAAEAIYIMNKLKITSLFVTDKTKNILGIVHMHDILINGVK